MRTFQRSTRALLPGLAWLCLAGCGDQAGPGGATADAGASHPDVAADGGSPDAGAADVGPPDAGSPAARFVGRTYVQDGGVGVASYHFDAEDDVSIHYENFPTCRLDDGRACPARKAFTRLRFDGARRTFFGTIDWSDPERATINRGDQRWEYEMVFSEDGETIEGGQITPFDASGRPRPRIRYNVDLAYQRLH